MSLNTVMYMLLIWARGTPEDPHTFDLVIHSGYEITEQASCLGRSRYTIGEPI